MSGRQTSIQAFFLSDSGSNTESEQAGIELLNHLMIVHIHRDREINLMEAISEFVSRNSERVKVFGAP